MKSINTIVFGDSRYAMSSFKDNSIDLMVTSPPYPMIDIWDESFCKMVPEIKICFKQKDFGDVAFDYMHSILDVVWKETYRVLKDGGIACINIGNATRSINKKFKVYPNYARVLLHCAEDIGFDVLPSILWRKPTNAPNKFMGSGMLPGGAYVTMEHEYIIVLRKGNKKEYKSKESKELRQKSAYFWEERNIWFSDLWDFRGTRQKINKESFRKRSTAYPIELAYRLINMYSSYGDCVLDPFLGTGTTLLAAIACGRNGYGIERDLGAEEVIKESLRSAKPEADRLVRLRMKKHSDFIKTYTKNKGRPKYFNDFLNTPVVTSQEKNMELYTVDKIKIEENLSITTEYKKAEFDI